LDEYTGNGSQVNEIRGLLLNADYLRDSLLRQVLQSNVYSGKTGWIVKGRDDKTILKSENSPSGSITVRTNFEGGFPPWSVELYQQNPDLFETFFSRRGIYFYMFFLLAGILIFGLILTIRTVAHELELSKMKSDFVSTVSHEFKSPLSSIRQLAEMLQSGRVPSEERRQLYYDVLVEQSERLSLLIDNILDFAKIEEGRKEFNFEIIEIGPLLEEIVSIIQDRVRHKDFVIQVKMEKPLPSINADRAAITQAITNLIDNAIKYSGEAKNILVRAFAENQYLIITIKDFGVGIRKEEIDKVFERFYRGGDTLTRTVKGSGLGLTLVKQIVEVHRGNVNVESEPGKGSTFSIRLPLQLIDNK
jgi:signal transduction histidine kinase